MLRPTMTSHNQLHLSSLLPTFTLMLNGIYGNGDVVVNKDGYLEYCNAEEFEAHCSEGHVIYMKNASYGRMRTGRCVDTDFGYVGCGTNVLHLADWMCSGRPQCTIPVPNTHFKEATDCPIDLTPYFEAAYDCLPVETAPDQVCKELLLPRSDGGFLSNHVMLSTKKGSEDCPWIIEGRSGQRVNFTVFDFGRKDLKNEVKVQSGLERVCRVYAVIRERDQSRANTICSGNGRQVHAYLSNSHAVEVRIMGKKEAQRQDFFLLKYQIVGCADPEMSEHAWMERDGDVAVIGCTHTNQKWRLICDGSLWTGTYGNCSSGSGTSTFGEIVGTLFGDMSFEVSVSIVVGIAVGIGLIILVCGVVFVRSLCRNKYRARRSKDRSDSSNSTPSQSEHRKRINTLKKPLPPSPRSAHSPRSPHPLASGSPRSPHVSSAHPLSSGSPRTPHHLTSGSPRSPHVSTSKPLCGNFTPSPLVDSQFSHGSPRFPLSRGFSSPLHVDSGYLCGTTLPHSAGVMYTHELHGPLPPLPVPLAVEADDACVTENEYAYIAELPEPPPRPRTTESPLDNMVLANPMTYPAPQDADSELDYTSPPTPYTSPRHSDGEEESTTVAGSANPLASYVCKNQYSHADPRNAPEYSINMYGTQHTNSTNMYGTASANPINMYGHTPSDASASYFDVQPGIELVPYESQEVAHGPNSVSLADCGILESRFWRNKQSPLFKGEPSDYEKTGTM